MTIEGRIVLEVSSLTEGLTRIVLSGRLDTPGVDQIETQFVAAAVPPAKNTRDMLALSKAVERLVTSRGSEPQSSSRRALLSQRVPQPLNRSHPDRR